MRFIAIQQFDYNGTRRNPGDEFDIDNPVHGALLIQGGRVREKQQQKLETRAMRSKEPEKEKEPDFKQRRRYPNRMMVSED